MWSKVKYLIDVYRELKRATSFYSMLGGRLIISSLVIFIGPRILLRLPLQENQIFDGLELSIQDVETFSYLIGLVALLIGVSLIIYDIILSSKTARKIAKAMITGLPGMSTDFPVNILSKAEQANSREPVFFGMNNPGRENIQDHINRFNAELCVDIFHRFVLHQSCEKLFIGGLTRVPLLVAYGTFLKNVNAHIFYFDKFHRDGKWNLLNEEDENVTLSYDNLITSPNTDGDIGIAIGFSTKINKDQLPLKLMDFTTIISPSSQFQDRNLIKNQDNLQRIGAQVRQLIDNLNSSSTLRVHLFLSVQSSLAIEIGRCFQEGTHKPWVIHNFDALSGRYSWAILLSQEGIKEFVFP
jgi:hypothetical protein